MHPRKEIQQKKSRTFQLKVEYEGDTEENNHNTKYSQLDNDNLVINLDKEQEYKEYDECIEDYSIVN